jgi:fructose/tagatose bisphosphate aldolase
MTKNVIDTIIAFTNKYGIEMTFIPSRRQIEHDGGYVCNWTTKEFVKYVKSKNNNIKIERDHGGPKQGTFEDDGYNSLKEDSQYLDIIHLDPWKAYPHLEEGIEWTIEMITYCNSLNPNLEYEVGTEEAIRPYSVEDLDYILGKLKNKLSSVLFSKIKYVVIQCGTKLSEGSNTGSFDANKLVKMIEITKKYGVVAKEHNGDWISLETHFQKEALGLQCVNIAPEMGKIESAVVLKQMKENNDDYDALYKICLDSEKWKKWVSPDFDCYSKKDEIILITGHYIFSHPEFISLKQKYPNIDIETQNNIFKRLVELHQFSKDDKMEDN